MIFARSGGPMGLGAAAVLAVVMVAGCGASPPAEPATTTSPGAASTPVGAVTATPAPTGPAPTGTPAAAPGTGATPRPAWLGTRPLPTDARGFGIADGTPQELTDRRLITVDELPPPTDGAFHSRIQAVPPEVVLRSTWSAGCPVPLTDLRYLTVSFRGFDGHAHTGELIVNRRAADGVVRVFRRLFAEGFPIERMKVTTAAEQAATPTGDGNNTSSFVCRGTVTSKNWSEHAYGLAVDVNPFHNPYVKGALVLPELAEAYQDRDRSLPGMVTADGPVVAAFRSIGWYWGGDWRSSKDYMHFSATGG